MVVPIVPELSGVGISPQRLAQELLRDNPWQMLVACILLNQTNGMKQVKPMLGEFFARWPDADALLAADEADIKAALRPLGFQNIRVRRLVGMSRDWNDGKRPPAKLYGVGKYAEDSYNLFVARYLVLDVQDKELKRYVEWAQQQIETGVALPGGIQLRSEESAQFPDEPRGEGEGEVQPQPL